MDAQHKGCFCKNAAPGRSIYGRIVRLLDGDVVVRDIESIKPPPRQLHIYAFRRLVHDTITERDVAHSRATNRANGKPDTAGCNPLEQHVLGTILDCDGIILVP